MTRIAALAATVAAAVVAGSAAAHDGASCSAHHLSTTLPKQTLPAKVAAVRQRIVDAAVACDYQALERIGEEKGTFKFTYGGEKSAVVHWMDQEARGAKPLARLVKILKLPVTRNELGWYAWPSAYTEKPKAADWNALVRAGVYPKKQVAQMRKHGMYLGYRTAITKSGDWQFFVAGD